MNRIVSKPTTIKSSSGFSIKLKEARLQTTLGGTAPHILFAPLHYEKNYAYPLLVWLHGPGDDERQLTRIMPLLSMRNYVAVGPRGSCRDEQQPLGYCWQQSEQDIAVAQQRVLECIRLASETYHVAADRVFLGGYDCGGTMALRIGLKLPERFAGVLSIGGAFPTGLAPLVNLRSARRLPLFIAQGRDALKYSCQQACDELRLFHSAGLSVSIRQYPCGDELTTQMLYDTDAWMMERVTGVQSFDDDTSQPLAEGN